MASTLNVSKAVSSWLEVEMNGMLNLGGGWKIESTN
jgi:hypothetical protein